MSFVTDALNELQKVVKNAFFFLMLHRNPNFSSEAPPNEAEESLQVRCVAVGVSTSIVFSAFEQTSQNYRKCNQNCKVT